MEDVNVVRFGTFGKSSILANLLKTLEGTTGLEPATSCVTGMRSNQLNYVPEKTDSPSQPLIDSLKNLALPPGLATPGPSGFALQGINGQMPQ